MDTQVDGIISINDVIQVKVKNTSGETVRSRDKKQKPVWIQHHKLPLNVENEGSLENVGELEIWMTLDNMYYRLGVKVIYFFITQLFKTFLVSSIMFLIFNHFIFKHIVILDHYFRNFKVTSLSILKDFISLPFKEHEVNELTRLRDRVNEMIKILQKYDTDLREELNSAQNQNFNLNESQSRLQLISSLGHETQTSMKGLDTFFIEVAKHIAANHPLSSALELAKTEVNLVKSNMERVDLILTGNKGEQSQKTFEQVLNSTSTFAFSTHNSDINVDIKMDSSKNDLCPYPWINVAIANILQACASNLDSKATIFMDFKAENNKYKLVVFNQKPLTKNYDDQTKLILDLGLNSCDKMINLASGRFQIDQTYREGLKIIVEIPTSVEEEITQKKIA
jgi:hypothetical protein